MPFGGRVGVAMDAQSCSPPVARLAASVVQPRDRARHRAGCRRRSTSKHRAIRGDGSVRAGSTTCTQHLIRRARRVPGPWRRHGAGRSDIQPRPSQPSPACCCSWRRRSCSWCSLGSRVLARLRLCSVTAPARPSTPCSERVASETLVDVPRLLVDAPRSAGRRERSTEQFHAEAPGDRDDSGARRRGRRPIAKVVAQARRERTRSATITRAETLARVLPARWCCGTRSC